MKDRRVWLAIVLAAVATTVRPFEVLFDGESPYHHVRVTEEDGFRYLSFDETRGTQSAMKISDPIFLHYTYARLAMAGLAFFEKDPRDVLIVGLGGGSMPKFLRHHYPQMVIDIVDIDPLVVEVAKKYFGFVEDTSMTVINRDGRVHISRTKKKYDIIFLDAYNTASIPFHLTTREFMEEVRRCLKPNGIVVSNIWSPDVNQYFEAEIKTLQVVFPELYIFPGYSSGNYIFISTNEAGQIPRHRLVDRAAEITREKKFHFDLADLIRGTYEYATKRPTRAQVLTDDLAPVETLRTRRPSE